MGLSCSHFHMEEIVEQPRDKSARAMGEHLIAFFVAGAKSGLATVIVHPLKPFGSDGIYDAAIASLSDGELFDALSVAAEAGVAIEITTQFLPPDAVRIAAGRAAFSIETPLRVLSLAKKAGCKFSLGSDGHSLDAVRQIKELKKLVGPLNLTKEDMAPITKWS